MDVILFKGCFQLVGGAFVWTGVGYIGRCVLFLSIDVSSKLFHKIRVNTLYFSDSWLVEAMLIFNIVDHWVDCSFGIFKSGGLCWAIWRVCSYLCGFVACVWFVGLGEGHRLIFVVFVLATSEFIMCRCVEKIAVHILLWFNIINGTF